MRIKATLAKLSIGILLLIACTSAYCQVTTEPMPYNGAQYDGYMKALVDKSKVNFLLKPTLTDIIPLPFFDDFSGGDVSWALSRFYFALPINQVWFWDTIGVGRAFGNQGLSIRTPNRGKEWTKESSLGAANILSVDFLGTSGNGWGCGSKGWLAQTTDSGKTWQLKPSPAANAQSPLVAVSFADPQNGVLADSSGNVYRTDDGGVTWHPTVGQNFKSRSLFWKYPTQVYSAGDSGKIARSLDSGKTWSVYPLFPKPGTRLNKIIFTSPVVGLALGDSGLIYRTQDGGNFWYRANSYTTGDILDADFKVDANPKIGWAVGRDGLLLGTTDGGQNWKQIRSGTGDDLNCVRMITSYRGWIGTSNGRLLQAIIDPFRASSKNWERNSGTYINNTLCVNPISYGVATFDGLNDMGLPYSLVNNAVGACDSLISTQIDLAAEPNPVYVSFFWQNGGLIKEVVPDAIDSLILQFKGPNDYWVSVWQTFGIQNQVTTPFRYKSVLVSDSFKHGRFQFRFINFGNQNANYDSWNLDYVRVDTQHSPADSSAVDIAITQVPSPLLNGFRAYPLDQFNEIVNRTQLFSSTINGQLRNLNPGGGNNVNAAFILRDEARQQILGTFTEPIIPLDDPILANHALVPFYVNRSSVFPFLSKIPNWTTLRYGVVPVQDLAYNAVAANDTLYAGLNLSTYMAYDDGSAELVRGVDGNNGRGAVRFFLERTDTITDIDLYFPRVLTTQTQTISFLLMVYSDIDTILNKENELFRISYVLPPSDSLNKFDHFSLRSQPIEKRILQGGKPFYVGWQQNVIDNENQVRIGCDINSSSPGTFYYNSNSQWLVRHFDDYALMIRPVFGIESPTAVKGMLGKPKAPFFPNPTQNQIRNKESFSNLEIFNSIGQQIEAVSFGMPGQAIPLNLKQGLYTLKWQQADSQWVSQRLMVE